MRYVVSSQSNKVYFKIREHFMCSMLSYKSKHGGHCCQIFEQTFTRTGRESDKYLIMAHCGECLPLWFTGVLVGVQSEP